MQKQNVVPWQHPFVSLFGLGNYYNNYLLVNSSDQLADMFVKSLRGPQVEYIFNKLHAYDICSSLRESFRM